jgi:D-sedoheptulose 7-phosphate isomerase
VISNSGESDPAHIFVIAIAEHLDVECQMQDQQGVLEAIARSMFAGLRTGGKILWCGNPGSAADLQHFPAEIGGRFRRERPWLPTIALTTDTLILNALANNYDYATVFGT